MTKVQNSPAANNAQKKNNRKRKVSTKEESSPSKQNKPNPKQKVTPPKKAVGVKAPIAKKENGQVQQNKAAAKKVPFKKNTAAEKKGVKNESPKKLKQFAGVSALKRQRTKKRSQSGSSNKRNQKGIANLIKQLETQGKDAVLKDLRAKLENINEKTDNKKSARRRARQVRRMIKIAENPEEQKRLKAAQKETGTKKENKNDAKKQNAKNKPVVKAEQEENDSEEEVENESEDDLESGDEEESEDASDEEIDEEENDEEENDDESEEEEVNIKKVKPIPAKVKNVGQKPKVVAARGRNAAGKKKFISLKRK